MIAFSGVCRGLGGLACTCLLFVTACNSAAKLPTAAAPQLVAYHGSQQRPVNAADLQRAKAELEALSPPEGVAPDLWKQLQDDFLAELDLRTRRQAALLPNPTHNTVSDAQIVSDGAGGWNASWTYRNQGDYDLNGEVNAADIAPIAKYFRVGTQSTNWDSAQAADGDANGEVNGADIVPIAANFFSQVLGYNIYGAESESGPWTVLVGSVSLSAATSGHPRQFTFALGVEPPPFILLSPYDSSGEDWQGGVDPVPAEVNLGTDILLVNQVVPPTGATLSGPVGSPIEGVTLSIPDGAFGSDTQVSLGYNDGSITPVAGTQLGAILEITTDYGQDFEEALTVTLPYSGAADEIPIPFYIEPDGGLDYIDLSDLNPGAGTFAFETQHASAFAVILARATDPLAEFYDTRFDPKKNGFQIPNNGSTYNAEGECLGMSWFAGWFYKQSITDLFVSYTGQVGSSGLSGQDVIATRAHNSIHTVYDSYLPHVKWQTDKLSDAHEWLVLQYVLVNAAQPVIVCMKEPGSSKGHAVLAYAVVGDDLFVYDPNAPGQTPRLTFDGSFILPFGTYSQFATIGTGRYSNEYMSNIYADAEAGFSSPNAALSFSPPVGDVTDMPTIEIAGYVDSGEVLIEAVKLIGDGKSYSAAFGDFGQLTFSNIPIHNGNNYFKVVTNGLSARNSTINVKNNLTDTRGIVIIGEDIQPPPTVVTRLELTWGPTNTGPTGEFELYVREEPNDGTGPYFLSSSNGNQQSPSGLRLVVSPPGPDRPGGTLSIVVDSSVSGTRIVRYCIHRTDIQPELSPCDWVFKSYFGDDTVGSVFDGGRINNGDSMNMPDFDSVVPQSAAWSGVKTYGL